MQDSEREIKTKIRRYLKKVSGSKFISYTPAAWGEIGTPDIIGCIRGKMVLIEVKRPGRKPTPLQALRLREWHDAGALSMVVTSAEDVILNLRKEIDNV